MIENHKKYFTNLWERLAYLAEQDMAQAAAAPLPQTSQPETPSVPEQAKDQEGNQLSVDGLISRINMLRGGKSLNDAEVYGQLTTLFKQTSENDKIIIDGFLSKLVDLVKVENEPLNLQIPSNVPQANPTTSSPTPQSTPPTPSQTSYNPAPPPINPV